MTKVINISEATQLALHSMVYIAKSNGSSVTTKQIADTLGASDNHLSKVMQRLVKSGFVKSNRGPSGGFTMAMDPNVITLYDIYEAIEGKIDTNPCPFGKNECFFDKCIFGNEVSRLSNEFINYFRKTRLIEAI